MIIIRLPKSDGQRLPFFWQRPKKLEIEVIHLIHSFTDTLRHLIHYFRSTCEKGD